MLKRKMNPMNLILASGSPRRRELLSLYTTDFTVCVSDFDEGTVQADTPAQLVEQLARGKCLAVSAQHPGAVVIGCDTVVDVNGEVFGKPHSTEDAKRMLRALSGAAHSGPCGPLAGPHRGRLLHDHGPAGEPHRTAAGTFYVRKLEKTKKTCANA